MADEEKVTVLELADHLLDDKLDATFQVSSAGGYRLIINVPSYLCPRPGKAGLLKAGDTLICKCYLPWRRIAKEQAKADARKNNVRGTL